MGSLSLSLSKDTRDTPHAPFGETARSPTLTLWGEDWFMRWGHRSRMTKTSASIIRLIRTRKPIVRDVEFENAFTIHSEPSEFAAAVLTSPKLRQGMLCLREHTTVEVKGDWLSLERLGLEKDVDYLIVCLDLMSDLACAVELAVTPPPVRR